MRGGVGVNNDKYFYHCQGMIVKKDKKFFQGHARLAEERERLWETQQQAADFFGVSRVTWGQYERGNATPAGDVLAGLAQRGADVLYILTGQRTPASLLSVVSDPPPRPDFNAEEAAILSDYRASDAHGRSIIKATSRAAAQAARAHPSSRPGRRA